MSDTELRVSINGDACDVFLNGTTDDLVTALSAAIRSMAINLADNTNLEELNEVLGLDKDTLSAEDFRESLQEIFVPMIISALLDRLDSIIDENGNMQEVDKKDISLKNFVSDIFNNMDEETRNEISKSLHDEDNSFNLNFGALLDDEEDGEEENE